MAKNINWQFVHEFVLVVFCCFFYFFYLPISKLSSISLALLVVFGAFYFIIHRKDILSSKLFVLIFFTVVYLYLSTWVRLEIFDHPVRFKYAEDLASFFIFIFVGLSLGFNGRAKQAILYSLILGVLFYFIINFDSNDWVQAFNGVRVDFNIRNAQHTGVIFCLLAFVSLFLLNLKYIKYVLFVAFFALMLFAQVRAIILGLAISGFIYLFLSVLFKSKRQVFYLLVSALIVALFLFLFQKENIVNRMSLDSSDLQALSLYLDGEKASTTSSVIRVMSWEIGFGWFKEKPLLGHGSGAINYLIDSNDVFKNVFKGRFGHLHNSYLELVIAYGLVGLLLYLSVAILLVYNYVKKILTYDELLIKNKDFLFLIIFLPTWLVANFFESYIFYSSGVYINSLFFGYLFYIAYMKNEVSTNVKK